MAAVFSPQRDSRGFGPVWQDKDIRFDVTAR
jgi:hypothetical protein